MSILKHSGLRALGSASVAAFALAACGGSGSANDELPLLHADVTIKSVSEGGVCDTIPVRVTPKELKGQANKYANNKMMVTDVATTGPTDENGAPMCNGTNKTLPLAPGNWEFSAALASGTTTWMPAPEGTFQGMGGKGSDALGVGGGAARAVAGVG